MRASAGSMVSSASCEVCCSHSRCLTASSGIREGRVCFRQEALSRTHGRRCCCRAWTSSCRVPIRRGLRSRRHESDFHGIVHVVSAPELARPALGRLEEVRQRRHGPVVKIGRAQPQTVERNRDITVWSSGMPRTSSRARRRRRCSAFASSAVHASRRCRSVPISSIGMTVPVRDPPDAWHAAHEPSKTARPSCAACLVDRERIRRRANRADVVLDPREDSIGSSSSAVRLRRPMASADDRTTFFQVRVRPVPEQRHAVARTEVPQRHGIGSAHRAVDRLSQERELHLVDHIGPAPAPVGALRASTRCLRSSASSLPPRRRNDERTGTARRSSSDSR